MRLPRRHHLLPLLEGDVLGAIGALGSNAPGLDRAKQAERAKHSSISCCYRCKLQKFIQCGLQRDSCYAQELQSRGNQESCRQAGQRVLQLRDAD